MFNQTFVELEPRPGKPYSLLVSLLFQIGTLCVLVLIPLLYTQTLPNAQLRSMLMAPPPPTHDIPLKQVVTSRASAPMARSFSAQLVAPRVTPKQIPLINDTGSAPDLSSAVPTGDSDGAANNSLLFGTTAPSAPVAPPPSVKPSPVKPMRVGGVVAEANLIHRVEPIYPPLAKAARVQGSVEFTALISKEGRVENLQLVRGHPLLVTAAKTAILQWQYRPTLLNGQKVDVLTSIVVNFKLSE